MHFRLQITAACESCRLPTGNHKLTEVFVDGGQDGLPRRSGLGQRRGLAAARLWPLPLAAGPVSLKQMPRNLDGLKIL